MRIHISHNNWCKGRISPLYNSLKRNNDVTINNSLEEIPTADVWIVDWFDTTIVGMQNRINSYEHNFLKYTGKLLAVSLDDGCITYTHGIKQSIINRLDGWFTGILWDEQSNMFDVSVKDKFILIPRFLISRLDMDFSRKKTNQIVFWGSTTGGLKLNGKNPRVEALKIIDNNNFIKSNFKGGLTYNYIIDCEESDEYKNSYQKFVVPVISHESWWQILTESTLCPNMEGNGLFSYRPLESMRSKATIISPPFFKDPGDWLFSEKLKNCVWFYNRDLSNFAEICEKALLDVDKTLEMSDEAYDVYKTYFESDVNESYNKMCRSVINDKVEKLLNISLF